MRREDFARARRVGTANAPSPTRPAARCRGRSGHHASASAAAAETPIHASSRPFQPERGPRLCEQHANEHGDEQGRHQPGPRRQEPDRMRLQVRRSRVPGATTARRRWSGQIARRRCRTASRCRRHARRAPAPRHRSPRRHQPGRSHRQSGPASITSVPPSRIRMKPRACRVTSRRPSI